LTGGTAPRAGAILTVAMSAALLAGVLEVIRVLAAFRSGLSVRLSSQFLWMTPLTYVLIFGCIAVLMIGLGRVWPKAASRRVAVAVFTGLAAYSILLNYAPLYRIAMLLLAAGLAVQAARWSHTRLAERMFRVAPWGAATLAALVAVVGVTLNLQLRAATDAAMEALPPAGRQAPNVLLLILDTVRARSMGLYDAAKPNTPELDRLAASATVFDAAIAPSPWTLPTHASLFTGQWPHDLSADWQVPLDRTHPTLAEVLSARGYLTGGFVANLLFATRATGLGRGFLHYDDYPLSFGQMLLSAALFREISCSARLRQLIGWHDLLNRRSAEDITDAFLAWPARGGERPWFAFLNYYDAHEPLWPPADRRAAARYEHRCSAATGADAHIVKDELDESGRRAFEASYERAIGRIDTSLGRLLRALEADGSLDNTIIIVTSDHGEQIGENGLFHHHNSLYLPALHVPLLVRYPPAVPQGARVGDVATLREVAATILDLLGDSAAAFPGESLARHWQAVEPAPGAALAHLTRGIVQKAWYPTARGPVMFSMTRDGFHYILNGDGAEELYDLGRDPLESDNLAAAGRADSTLAVMRWALQQAVGRAPAPLPAARR
jgi:arylsulfatase A-like enzyme